MNVDEQDTDVSDVEPSVDTDTTPDEGQQELHRMTLEEMRAELDKHRKRADEAIETRQKAKQKAKSTDEENRELKRRLTELERAAEDERKTKLKKKERYDELIREEEEIAVKRNTKLKSLLEGKQFDDLFSKVMDQGGIDPANQKVLKPFLRDIAKDLDLISEVDPMDIDSLEIRGADEKSVAAALRQLRKDAPGFFNKASAEGGDVPGSANGQKDTAKPSALPKGIDPNDPRLADVIRAARGR